MCRYALGGKFCNFAITSLALRGINGCFLDILFKKFASAGWRKSRIIYKCLRRLGYNKRQTHNRCSLDRSEEVIWNRVGVRVY